MKKRCGGVMLVGMIWVLAGCAPYEVVPSSGPHQATSPESVKLYQTNPKKYEELGIVTVNITPEMKWDQRGESPLAFDALKAKAAQLGANGILFVLPPEKFEFKVTAACRGTFYQVPARQNPKMALAQAIYVIEQ